MCIINSPREKFRASDLDCRSARRYLAKHSSPDAPGATRRAGGPAEHGLPRAASTILAPRSVSRGASVVLA